MLCLSSCASIVNGKYQKVKIHTGDVCAKVYLDDSLIGSGEVFVHRFRRDFLPKQLRIERAGFETRYQTLIQSKKSPLYIISWIPFGAAWLIPPLFDQGPKSYNYRKNFHVAKKVPQTVNTQPEKNFFLGKLHINDTRGYYLSSKKIKTYHTDSTFHEKHKNFYYTPIDVMQLEWAQSSQHLLNQRKFADSTFQIFQNPANAFYIDAEVDSMDFIYVNRHSIIGSDGFLLLKTDICWLLRDIYGQTLYADTIESCSDEFAFHIFGKSKEINVTNTIAFYQAFNNSLEKGLLDFLNSEDLKSKTDSHEQQPPLQFEIEQTAKVTSLVEAGKACVSVSSVERMSSGFFIGDAGEIVTTYSVVSSGRNPNVTLSDGTVLKAKIVAVDKARNLAIIKVEHKGHLVFDLNAMERVELAEQVYVIEMSSETVDFTKRLVEGIISGDRNTGTGRILQTDASITMKALGAPMVSKEGRLIGVINSKLVREEIDGISFAVPAADILGIFNLKTK